MPKPKRFCKDFYSQEKSPKLKIDIQPSFPLLPFKLAFRTYEQPAGGNVNSAF